MKSLVFMADDRPVLALTSGANRVDEAKLAWRWAPPTVRRASPRRHGPPRGSRSVARRRSGTAPVTSVLDPDLHALRRDLGGGGHPGLGLRAPGGTAQGHGGRDRRCLVKAGCPGRRSWSTRGSGRMDGGVPPEQHDTGGTMITLTENAAGKVKELAGRGRPRRHRAAGRRAAGRVLGSALRDVPGRPAQREGPGRGAVRRPARDRQDERALPVTGQDRLRRHAGAVGFTIDNPAAQGGCACGNSFH